MLSVAVVSDVVVAHLVLVMFDRMRSGEEEPMMY
jgi:hypothetical protein